VVAASGYSQAVSCKQVKQKDERRLVLAAVQGQGKQQQVDPMTTLRCFDLHSTFCRCSDLEVQPTQEEDLNTIAEFLAAAAVVAEPEHWLGKQQTDVPALFVAAAAAVVPDIVVFALQVASM